ncbi:hypothetical protein TNCV_3681151 [Trichonephila clavipes]|uniref:Uncharacterized protein n=1 Tax=Trichonephila clavipes TaxID=2585209 RepID=A0A8X6V380_TRICX|nr:hypothetical protein TNCV_3681151 [Trichonephila clavipes]
MSVRLSEENLVQARIRCLAFWIVSLEQEHWSVGDKLKRFKKALKFPCPVRNWLRVLVAALWDKKLAFRTRERRQFWAFTDGPQRWEKKTSSEAVLKLNSASEKKSVLLKEDQTDL